MALGEALKRVLYIHIGFAVNISIKPLFTYAHEESLVSIIFILLEYRKKLCLGSKKTDPK